MSQGPSLNDDMLNRNQSVQANLTQTKTSVNIRQPKKFETTYILLQSYFLCRLQYNARHTKVFKIHLRTLCFNQKEGLSQIVMYIKNLIYINVPFH